MANRLDDITGRTFGRLTVIGQINKNKSGRIIWDCICQCGKRHMTTANLLKLGKTKSCGCLRKEKYKPSKIRWFSVLVDPAETGLYLTFGDSVEISLMVFQTGFGWFPTDAKISHWAYINLPE